MFENISASVSPVKSFGLVGLKLDLLQLLLCHFPVAIHHFLVLSMHIHTLLFLLYHLCWSVRMCAIWFVACLMFDNGPVVYSVVV